MDDLANQPGEEEPAGWALGFPTVDVHQYLRATPHARAVLGADPSLHTPAGGADLEDFVEFYLKVLRADAIGNTIALRWAARLLAEYAAGVLREFNPPTTVRTPVEAIRAAMTLPDVPEHYQRDFETCAALRPAVNEEVIAAARRLAAEVLAFLRERTDRPGHGDNVRDRHIIDGFHAYLAAFDPVAFKPSQR